MAHACTPLSKNPQRLGGRSHRDLQPPFLGAGLTHRDRTPAAGLPSPLSPQGRVSKADTTYFQLAGVLPSNSMQECLLELAQECGGRAGQDTSRLCAPLPQGQATFPVRSLWDD